MKIIEKIIDKEMADTWQDSIKKDFDVGLRPKIISGRVYPAFFTMNPENVVLNLGIGLGPQAVTYKSNFKRMIGIDISKKKLVYAKKMADHYQLPLYLCCGNVEQLPFPKNSFDTVIAIDVIEHVLNPDKLLSEAFKVLNAKGHLVITFPCLIDQWNKILLRTQKIHQGLQNHDSFGEMLSGVYRAAIRSLYHFSGNMDKTRKTTMENPRSALFNPDTHKHDFRPKEWLQMIESSGFKIIKTKSTTLFPPLHTLGVAKFQYTNDTISKIDSFLSSQRFIKNFGQSMVCLARKGERQQDD